jgi:hypothetical protein
MKQKMKGNKLRKPKLKDNKLTREKELPINHPVSKSKAYRLNSGSNTSTPMNFNDRGRIVSNEIVGNRVIGKTSTNSFVFMKNSVSTIRKVSSYKVPDEEEKSEEKSEEIGSDFTKTSVYLNIFNFIDKNPSLTPKLVHLINKVSVRTLRSSKTLK